MLAQPPNSREWQSSDPLPITLSAAEKVARDELAKVAPEETDWIATEFQLSRFSAGSGWYYSVTLKPALQLSGERPEWFTVLLDLSGQPGRVMQLGRHQAPR